MRPEGFVDRPTQATADYVTVIYELRERGLAVTTTTVASRVGVTAASASAMLTRLGERGLVEHRRYAESSLTELGDRLALQVLRRRRLIESFLSDILGYSWDEIEREAETLSRAASDTFIDRIAERLGHPEVDPHGDPIPGPDGRLTAHGSQTLSNLDPGVVGRLVRVWNGDPEVLRYLDHCGIGLGDQIEVLGREPLGGPLMIRVGEARAGRVHALGADLARVLSIKVER